MVRRGKVLEGEPSNVPDNLEPEAQPPLAQVFESLSPELQAFLTRKAELQATERAAAERAAAEAAQADAEAGDRTAEEPTILLPASTEEPTPAERLEAKRAELRRFFEGIGDYGQFKVEVVAGSDPERSAVRLDDTQVEAEINKTFEALDEAGIEYEIQSWTWYHLPVGATNVIVRIGGGDNGVVVRHDMIAIRDEVVSFDEHPKLVGCRKGYFFPVGTETFDPEVFADAVRERERDDTATMVVVRAIDGDLYMVKGIDPIGWPWATKIDPETFRSIDYNYQDKQPRELSDWYVTDRPKRPKAWGEPLPPPNINGNERDFQLPSNEPPSMPPPPASPPIETGESARERDDEEPYERTPTGFILRYYNSDGSKRGTLRFEPSSTPYSFSSSEDYPMDPLEAEILTRPLVITKIEYLNPSAQRTVVTFAKTGWASVNLFAQPPRLEMGLGKWKVLLNNDDNFTNHGVR